MVLNHADFGTATKSFISSDYGLPPVDSLTLFLWFIACNNLSANCSAVASKNRTKSYFHLICVIVVSYLSLVGNDFKRKQRRKY